MFNAAALGLLDRVRDHLAAGPPPAEVRPPFWSACHGRTPRHRRNTSSDAELNWVAPWDGDGLTPVDAAHRGADDLAAWIITREARSA